MSNQSDLSISAIIPVYRDHAALTRLLTQLQTIRGDLLEIIVVDGADAADCRQLCAAHGVRWRAATPCRGAQLRAGAEIAVGAILWFLHADAQPPALAIEAIRAALKAPRAVGGYFRFALLGRATLGARLFTTLVNWRTLAGIPYGDQGIFVRATAYVQVDGHRPIPLLEEVRLIRRLRRCGRVVRLPLAMAVDARRYRRDGWLRRSLGNRLLALGYSIGIDPFVLAAWYNDRPGTAAQRDALAARK